MPAVNGTRRTFTVDANQAATYTVSEVDNIFDPRNDALCFNNSAAQTRKRVVVVDDLVWKIWHQQITNYFAERRMEVRVLKFLAGERNKNLSSLGLIWEAFEDFGVDRRYEPIIGIGGGVLIDVVGFAASTYRRGVPFIRVPTTLMAMVDGAIGAKNGINFANAKNRIGNFATPLSVLIDQQFLRTLPLRHVANGTAEIVKLAVVRDSGLFDALESLSLASLVADGERCSWVLERSIDGMLGELSPNLFEADLSRAMDFGHTFSPGMEMASPNLLHGEAVSIDVALSSVIAGHRELLTEVETRRILNLLKKFQLPIAPLTEDVELLWNSLMERVLHRGGLQHLPLPGPIGRCTFANDIDRNEIARAVQVCRTILEL